MINKQEAKKRALKYLNEHYDEPDDELVILDESTIERPYGWIFAYDSKKALKTENSNYRFTDTIPIVVEKVDGAIHEIEKIDPADPANNIRHFEIWRFGISDYKDRDDL